MSERTGIARRALLILAILTVLVSLVAVADVRPGPATGADAPKERVQEAARGRTPTEPTGTSVAPIGTEMEPERSAGSPEPAPDRRAVEGAAATIVTLGPYVSRQVNVTAGQNNIVGDAANEPSIAIDPTDPDRIVVGWRQFDTVASNFRQAGYAYSHDGGLTWTAGKLTPGVFRSDPVLAADSSGNFFYSSLTTPTANTFRVDMFRSADGGVTWPLVVNSFGGDKQWMTIDQTLSVGSGNIYQNWNIQFTCCPPNDFTRSVDGGLSFGSLVPGPLPNVKWGTLDVGADGTLYIGGSALSPSRGHLFARSTDARDAGLSPTFGFVRSVDLGGSTVTGGINPAGLLGQVWIKVDRSGGAFQDYAYMASTVRDLTLTQNDGNITNVKFVRSVDGGKNWSEPVRVNDLPGLNTWNWFATMSVAPNGRIDMIWNDTRGDPGGNLLCEVYYSHSLDAGRTWSANVPLSPQFDPQLGYPQQNKIGDYYHMISDNGGANLAYAATFNNEEDVYFLRIPQDCNGNGIDDDCDVACGAPGTRCDVVGCGASGDCNGNVVPDECEPNQDCQPNGTRDICDIGNGTSDDCDGNRVPDECDPQDDCDNDTTLDLCQLADGSAADCNRNGVLDACDIALGPSDDMNNDGVPDECQESCCGCGTCLDVLAGGCYGRGGISSGAGLCGEIDACTQLPVFANDACPDALALPSTTSLSVPIDNRCATLDGPVTVPCGVGSQPFGADLWFTYTAPCGGIMTASLCNTTGFDTIMAVYGGGIDCECPSDNAELLTCGDDTCGLGGGPSIVSTPVLAGHCYLIRLAGWSGDTGTGSLAVDLSPDPGTCGITQLRPLAAEDAANPGRGAPKSRVVSIRTPSAFDAGGIPTAIRVRLRRMYIDKVEDPVNGCAPRPGTLPDLSAFEDEVRWAGPPLRCSEFTAPPMQDFVSSELQCCPHFRYWSRDGLAADLGADAYVDVIHLFGAAVIPCSVYEVQIVAEDCPDLDDETCYSTVLTVPTAKWGDVITPFGGAEPNFPDINEVVEKFKGIAFDPAPPPAGAPIQASCMLRDNTPPICGTKVNFRDIGFVVEGYKQIHYRPTGPTPCGPCP